MSQNAPLTTSPLPDHQSADFATPGAAPRSSTDQQPRSIAEKLLQNSGSPDQAKQAVDEAARELAGAPLTKEDFARRFGFASFLEMFEASQPAGAKKGSGNKEDAHWLLTALRGGKWLLWNEREMHSAQVFDTPQEAKLAGGGSDISRQEDGAKYQA